MEISLLLTRFNRFVDRDMMMRFRGGGVGHKSTREATNCFLPDRDALDKGKAHKMEPVGEQPIIVFSEDDEELDEVIEPEGSDSEQEMQILEEFDYGYAEIDSDEDWEDLKPEGMDDELDGEPDLGAEDGEDAVDDKDDLGFADF